ncbi:MAG: arginyltransferase [Lentisphaeraceae bacterium]|nr:arginyltransferase [Lentisphaeraceae bacterium]
MVEIRDRDFSDEFQCPYLDQKARNEYFFAMELDHEDINKLLGQGWRKFGWYYFRPACDKCKSCIPLRVLTKDFKPSRSQRKVINKNVNTEVKVCNLEYRDEIYALYEKHSRVRFEQPSEKQDFIETHYFTSCPGLQTEYYVDEKLVAVGFLDHGTTGLSSVYFIYDTDYSHLSLGVYGAIKEIELAAKMDLDYYYLGYWINENASMRYKNKYYPHELMDWEAEKWRKVEKGS